jgi:hypothetical protein
LAVQATTAVLSSSLLLGAVRVASTQTHTQMPILGFSPAALVDQVAAVDTPELPVGRLHHPVDTEYQPKEIMVRLR